MNVRANAVLLKIMQILEIEQVVMVQEIEQVVITLEMVEQETEQVMVQEIGLDLALAQKCV